MCLLQYGGHARGLLRHAVEERRVVLHDGIAEAGKFRDHAVLGLRQRHVDRFTVQLGRAAAEGVDGPVLREPAVLTRDAAAAAEVGVFRREDLARQGRIRQCQPPGQIDAVRAELRQIPDVLRRAEQVDRHMHAVNAHVVERTGLHGGVENIRVLAAQIGIVARGILRIGDVRLLDAPELRQQQAAGLVLRHEQRCDGLKEVHAVCARGVNEPLHVAAGHGGGLFHDDETCIDSGIYSSWCDAISIDIVHVLGCKASIIPPYTKIFRIELFYKVIPVCALLQWQTVGGGISVNYVTMV